MKLLWINHLGLLKSAELKEEFLRQVGAYLKGEIEFNFEVTDPQPVILKITDRKGKEITNG